VALLVALALLLVLVTPLRFRSGPLGGPFRRGAASWTGVLAAAAALYSMLSVHGAAGSLRQSAVDDDAMDLRRELAVFHFYAACGYALAAVALAAKELALEALRLHTSGAARAAALDLYALFALALVVAAVLLRAPQSMHDDFSRLFVLRKQGKAALTWATKGLFSRAHGFNAEFFAGEKRVLSGDGLVAATALFALVAEALVDALERSSLSLAPLLCDATARGSPRARCSALTIDLADDDEAATGASGGGAALLGELRGVLARAGGARATFFFGRRALAAASADGGAALVELLADGHEVGVLGPEGEHSLLGLGSDADALARDFAAAAEAVAAAAPKAAEVARAKSKAQTKAKAAPTAVPAAEAEARKGGAAAALRATAMATVTAPSAAAPAGPGAAPVCAVVQWMRPAGGARAAATLRAAADLGLGVALWSASVDCRAAAGAEGHAASLPRQMRLHLLPAARADPAALDPTTVRGAVLRVERVSAAGLAAVLGALAAAADEATGGALAVVALSELAPTMGRDAGELLPVA
jgi:hypothetical protein